jgi:hypothetical protein
MQPTISREERQIRARQPQRSYFRPAAETSGSLLGNIYEGFLRMPVPVVLTALWLGGMVLVGSCVLIIYALATLLAQAVAGV